MTSPQWDVLGIGNAAVDELIYLDSFPVADTKMPVRAMQRQGGGLVATALVAAARQGARAAFCSLIGYDELSEFTLSDLAADAGIRSGCGLVIRWIAGASKALSRASGCALPRR